MQAWRPELNPQKPAQGRPRELCTDATKLSSHIHSSAVACMHTYMQLKMKAFVELGTLPSVGPDSSVLEN